MTFESPPLVKRLPLVLLALALVASFPAPAAATAKEVHLGAPASDLATTLSVLWMEDAPRDAPSVVLVTPEGPRDVPAALVPGPSAGFVYEARLDGLLPSTTYGYRVGDREFNFTTLPAALAPEAPLRIVALGDMGVTEPAPAAVRTVANLAPHLVLHAGDVSYAEGDPLVWAEWFKMVEPIASTIPWLIALGNHEAGFLGAVPHPTEVATVKQRFGHPGNELWWSVDVAGVHIVALDTYSSPAGIPPEEVAWLDADLAASANATWKIVVLHEPPYSSNARHGSSARVQQAFVPLFEKHGVDLVVAGHDHSYERTHPIVAGKPTTTASPVRSGSGPVYLVTGGGGRGLYEQWEAAPAWSAAREALHHVVLLTVTPDAIAGRLVPTSGGTYEDAFRIEKPAEPAAPVGSDPGAASTPGLPLLGSLLGVLGAALLRAGPVPPRGRRD